MQIHDNNLMDDFGLLSIEGNDNSVIGNHFSEIIDEEYLRPTGIKPIIIRIKKGNHNYISNNNFVAAEANAKTGDSAYAAQVNSLLLVEERKTLNIVTVLVDESSNSNTILDSGYESQVEMNKDRNSFRPLPTI